MRNTFEPYEPRPERASRTLGTVSRGGRPSARGATSKNGSRTTAPGPAVAVPRRGRLATLMILLGALALVGGLLVAVTIR